MVGSLYLEVLYTVGILMFDLIILFGLVYLEKIAPEMGCSCWDGLWEGGYSWMGP